MADKQSGAKAEASSRGLILRVLSPEEPLCRLFFFPFPIGIEGSHHILQSSLPVHALTVRPAAASAAAGLTRHLAIP